MKFHGAPSAHAHEQTGVRDFLEQEVSSQAPTPVDSHPSAQYPQCRPELRAYDTHLARFPVALVEAAIARLSLKQRRALVLLEQPDRVTRVMAWHIPASDAQRTERPQRHFDRAMNKPE